MIKDINMVDFFLINNVHIFLNNILPARTGEFSFFYMLKKRGINLTKSFWVFVLARFMDALALLGFFFGFFFKIYFLAFITIFGIIMVFLLKHTLAFLPNVFILKSLKQNLSTHFESKTAIKLYFISVISFAFKFLGFYEMAKNIIPMRFFDILPSYVLAEISSILPINGFLGLGTYEFGFSIPSKLTDISLKSSLDLAFITHVFLLISSSVLGIVSFLLLKLENYEER
ncbi:YbhN family protein [Hydrogenobaculum acidophilum]